MATEKTITKIDENNLSVSWTPEPTTYPEKSQSYSRQFLNLELARHDADEQAAQEAFDAKLIKIAEERAFTQSLLDALDEGQ